MIIVSLPWLICRIFAKKLARTQLTTRWPQTLVWLDLIDVCGPPFYALIYKNYTASYKNLPGAPIKFQEISSISRSCRHPDSVMNQIKLQQLRPPLCLNRPIQCLTFHYHLSNQNKIIYFADTNYHHAVVQNGTFNNNKFCWLFITILSWKADTHLTIHWKTEMNGWLGEQFICLDGQA